MNFESVLSDVASTPRRRRRRAQGGPRRLRFAHAEGDTGLETSGLASSEILNRVTTRCPRSACELLLGIHQAAELGELLAAELVAFALLDPIEQLAHQRRQLERIERLRHVVDAADVEPAGTIAELRTRRQEDDRYVVRAVVLEQGLRNPPAVEAGHHPVEQDDVGPLRTGAVEAARAVRSLEHLHLLC